MEYTVEKNEETGLFELIDSEGAVHGEGFATRREAIAEKRRLMQEESKAKAKAKAAAEQPEEEDK